MKHAFDQFCETIDRAFKGRPERKEDCARIFAQVFERLFKVTLFKHGGEQNARAMPGEPEGQLLGASTNSGSRES